MIQAKQGHIYEWNSIKVMAMESGPFPIIHRYTDGNVWPLAYIGRADAESLKPLPMVYFNGQVPK